MEKNYVLASTKSTQKSLEAIRTGKARLNKKRQSMLNRVPKTFDWARFKLNHIQNKDLAYLTAATGDEFALLRGKNDDILFHGSRYHCDFTDAIWESLVEKKFRIVCHSHPDEIIPIASDDDRVALEYIGQKKSVIISALTCIEFEFYSDRFRTD